MSEKEKTVKLSELTPEDKAALIAEIEAKKTAQKNDRKKYKSIASESVDEIIGNLISLAIKMKDAKTQAFNTLRTLASMKGEVFDVVVDIRKSSPTFGQSMGITLSRDNNKQLWVPIGFAHGFVVTSDFAEFLYKTTDYWAPEYERSIAWNDPDLNIEWPLAEAPALSKKDQEGVLLKNAEVFA